MKKISEEKVGGYVGSLISRNAALSKATDRHFQGNITAVSQMSDNGWPFLVNIDRTEGPDNHDYVCAISGYVPKIGDYVECEWRDEDTGYIKYPLAYDKFIATAALSAGFSIGTSPTQFNFDTLVKDAYACFDAALTGFTCPYSGVYRCNGSYRVTTATEQVVYFYVNGAVVRSPTLTSTTGSFATGGTAVLYCQKGDLIQMYGQNPTGAQNAGVNGIIANFFDVEYLGPL